MAQNLDELLAEAEEKVEKGEDLSEIESEHHGKNKEHAHKETVQGKIKQSKLEKNAAEEAELVEEEIKEEAEEKKKKKVKKGKAKVRSEKYKKAVEAVDKNKKYDLEVALELVKKTSYTKFDGNVEAHIRLLSKVGKPEQIRGMVQYPVSTGKSATVVILDEKMIDEIAKSGKAEADIYITTPADMPKVAKLAKILGPKGKMPNPKSGTITDNPEKAKAELEGGSTEYRTDSTGNIHQVIGKVSAKTADLMSNYNALITLLPKEKINSIVLTATMGPGVKVQK